VGISAGRVYQYVALWGAFEEARGREPSSVDELVEWCGASRSLLFRAQSDMRRMVGVTKRMRRES